MKHIMSFNESRKPKPFQQKVAGLKLEIIENYQQLFNTHRTFEKRFQEMTFDVLGSNIFNEPNTDYDYNEELEALENCLKELVGSGILIQLNPKKSIREGNFKLNPEYASIDPVILTSSPILAKTSVMTGVFDTSESFKINEDAQSYFKLIGKNGIIVDGTPIAAYCNLQMDDSYIMYEIWLTEKGVEDLLDMGLFVKEIQYDKHSDLDNNALCIYQTSKEISAKKLQQLGVDSAVELGEDDALKLVSPNVKFKFKKYTLKEFADLINDVDYYGMPTYTAVIKPVEETRKIISASKKQKLLSQFSGFLTQKDYYFLGKDPHYFNSLRLFKELKDAGITSEEAADFCLKQVGVKDFEKSNKLRKANSSTGMLD